MTAIISFIASFFTSLKMYLSWALDGCLYVIKGALYCAFDGLCTSVFAFFGAIDLTAAIANITLSWSGLPPQMLYLINAIGLPQCLGILVSAILIRMGLNLIPAAFTRI